MLPHKSFFLLLLLLVVSSSFYGKGEDFGAFRIFPQYQEIDYGAILNQLKSSQFAGLYLTSDTLDFLASNLNWLLFHFLFWNGKAFQTQDLSFPFRFLAIILGENDKYLSSSAANTSNSISKNIFNDIDVTTIVDSFVNPSNSIRSILYHLGVSFFTLCLWILPTFLWRENPTTSRISNTLNYISEGTQMTDIYNNLLCPQCVAQIIAINTFHYVAKWIYWSIFTRFPNFSETQSFSKGRQSIDEDFLENTERRYHEIVKSLQPQ